MREHKQTEFPLLDKVNWGYSAEVQVFSWMSKENDFEMEVFNPYKTGIWEVIAIF